MYRWRTEEVCRNWTGERGSIEAPDTGQALRLPHDAIAGYHMLSDAAGWARIALRGRKSQRKRCERCEAGGQVHQGWVELPPKLSLGHCHHILAKRVTTGLCFADR